MMDFPGFLGFPPPLLGRHPMRLPVLARGAGWIAMEKPAGIGLRQHPWDAGVPDLDRALNLQLRQGKPELLRIGADLFASAFHLDPEISGSGLFATGTESTDLLRNAVGSGKALFRFVFAAPSGGRRVGEEVVCEAPLVPHFRLAKAVPSSARGKRSRTVFRCLGVGDSGWSLWEATANLPRPHQIRVHAALCGLALPGDKLYAGPPVPATGQMPRPFKGAGASRPLFRGLPLHLRRFSMADLGIEIDAALPEALNAALRRLGLFEAV